MTIQELETAIRTADEQYYKNGTSPYTDVQYDSMKKQLRELDPNNPLLESLGEDHVDGFKKVKHEVRMLSLQKLHEAASEDPATRWAEVTSWLEKWSDKETQRLNVDVVLQPKIDGMSAEALYVNGELVSVSTRGNGDEGDDITDNVRHLFPAIVPSYTRYQRRECSYTSNADKFVIRGELYISKEEFARINEEQVKNGLEPFANPRNLCAGTVKSKEGLQGRNVEFVEYHHIALEDDKHYQRRYQSGDYCDDNILLPCNGAAPEGYHSIKDYQTQLPHYIPLIYTALEDVDKKRDTLPFCIDGAVLKLIAKAKRKELGETDHHPRWAAAVKFLPEKKKTVIKNILWQIGAKTGQAKPVGEVEPVELDGTIVSRVSLANAGQMALRGIAPGVEIVIVKSGEIIPYVDHVLTPVAVELAPTMLCPSCGYEMPLVQGKSAHTANYVCENPNCREKRIASLVASFGKDGLNVLGFGPETAAAFVDYLEVPQTMSHPALVRELVYMPRENYPTALAGKEGDNLFAEMTKARTAPLSRWIASNAIPGIGMGTAKKISAQCKDWNEFLYKFFERKLGLTDRQHENAIGRVEYLATLQEFDFWFNPESDNYVDPNATVQGKLGGKAFVVTGKFHTGRSAIEQMIPANGGILRSSVSRLTDYLVAGEDVGASKTKKAAACGTKVITEEEFLAMLK